MTEEDIYKKAQKKVKEKKDFYTHLGIYLVCVGFFFAINFLTGDHPHDDWWAFFPTLAWGVAIGIHYFSVFGIPNRHGEEWEERQLEKEMSKLHRKKNLVERDIPDITIPDDELELKEFKKLRDEWDDQEFV